MICQDITDAGDPAPRTPHDRGGPQCVAGGHTDWVHLRVCLACGLVACCDSSPRRHMTRHHEEAGHPVMRSYEPGETWRWCYLHETIG